MPEAKKKVTKATEKKVEPKAAEKKVAAKATPAPVKKAPAAKAAPAPKKVVEKAAPAPAKKAPAKKETPAAKPTAKKEAPKAAPAEPVITKGKYEIKRTNDGGYMFNVWAANYQIIAKSQSYTSKTACKTGINSVTNTAAVAAIEDQTLQTVKEEKCPKFQIYLDKGGKYRFNLIAKNGQNVLACTQGYTTKPACKNGIQSVIANAGAMIVIAEDDD